MRGTAWPPPFSWVLCIFLPLKCPYIFEGHINFVGQSTLVFLGSHNRLCQPLILTKRPKKLKKCLQKVPSFFRSPYLSQTGFYAYNEIWIKRSKTSGPVDFVLTVVYCINFKKMRRKGKDHDIAKAVVTFQLPISITVETSPITNYQRTYRKNSKRAITLKKIKISKKWENLF